MKNSIVYLAALILIGLLPRESSAQLYYDTNEATPGTATSSTQNFTDSVWTTDATGSSLTAGYVAGSDVVFSAGTNGTGTQQVTVTDTESVNSFAFDNGTVALYGSGSPNLSIGEGGVLVNSTDGPTTFDSSLGTVTLAADQSWNNDSSQAFNVNSNVTAAGDTLSFAGTGTGNVNVNGVLSGNLNLTQNSASSVLYLNNNGNNFTGNITANGGSFVAATQGSMGNSSNTVTLSNGGTAEFNNHNGFNAWTTNIVLGTGGGKFYAGSEASGGVDLVYSGLVTGGTGFTLLGGDFLPSSTAASNVGTLNVAGGRLLAFGDGIFGNNAAVNVSSGAILAFSNTDTLNNTITLADGSALENRNNNITLTNVVLPTTGTVILGSDDVGGGSMTIASNISLSNPLTLDVNASNGGTTVNLSGTISGSGALTVNPGPTGNSLLELSGNNNYTGPTTLNSVTVGPGSTGFGNSTVTLNSSAIYLTGGTLATKFVAGTGTSYFEMAPNAGNETLTGNIELSQPNDQVNISNNTTANLTVGDITFDAVNTNDRVVAFDASNTSSITLAGTYVSPDNIPSQSGGTGVGASSLTFGEGDYNGSEASANYYLSSTADFSQMEPYDVNGKSALALVAGNLYLDNSTFVSGQVISIQGNTGDNHTIDVVGAQTINAYVYVNLISQFTIGQSTADSSSWTGVIQQYGGLIASAVDGGRLDFTADIAGDTGSSVDGVVKTGAGTVVFSNANGNDYTVEGSVAADIKQGTLLVTNTANSAFGKNSGTVNIEAGAKLGGSGTVLQQVVVNSVTVGGKTTTGIVTAGDPGQANLGIAPSINTLQLTGGLFAANGVTLDFKIDGSNGTTVSGYDNDYIYIGLGDLTLKGTVTVNIINLNSILTGTPYTLMAGTGDWTEGAPSFDFNLPAGYALDANYGTDGDGYDFNDGDGTDPNGTKADSFTVEFVAVPEPSAYAMIGLGLLSLAAVARFRRRTI
jgi:fibronectin-binding autotransporter adhesin